MAWGDRIGGLVAHRSGEVVTADALRARVAARAEALAARGAAPGQRGILAGAEGIALAVDLLALWQVGAAGAVVSLGLTAPERAALRRALKPVVEIDGSDVGHGGTPGEAGDALILTTSGTSGAPKAVVLTEAALTARIALNHAHIPEAERGRTLCLLPLHFGHGLIGNLLTPWLGGGDVVLWPQPSLAELAGLGPAIDAHGIDFLSSVPSLWQILRRLDAPRPTRALRRVHIGSAPLPPDLRPWVSAWAGTENVWDMYGMTEAGNWISGSATGGLGAPWGGEVAVLTDEGIAPAGRGEILIRSPALMRGYWERPDLTRAVFEGDWFRTGDLGHVEAGEITLTGRRSAQINRAGVKIQPEEIEALALACPGVETACCFAYPEPVAGEGAGLAITGPATPAEAQAFLRARLMAERLPDKWIKLDRLPVTDRGKPDRRALAALI